MNSQHKLYDFEMTPPAEAWNRIAVELDEIEQYSNLSKKLGSLEVAAPPMAWENIKHELQDEQSFTGIAKKLQRLEVQPPALAWNEIEKALSDMRPAAKLVPMHPARGAWLKYAAAAVLIGIFGSMAYYFSISSSRNAEKEIMANVDKEKQDRMAATLPAPEAATEKKQNTTETISAPGMEASRNLTAITNAPSRGIKTSSGNAYASTVEKNSDIQGRYIVLMTENGDVVRMSKKMGNMADCISGQDASADCNAQIAMWQEQVAKLPVASTPDNFLDILELATREQGL